MYQRILFAVDDGAASREAIPVVAAHARARGAAIRVLHVQHVDGGGRTGGDGDLVKSFVEAFSTAGVMAGGVVELVRTENVADAIARAAIRDQADLVAIGSRGRSDLGALFLGSVSHRVALDLDLPVLVIRLGQGAEAGVKRVLVAVDGSTASDDAVATATEVARATGAEVHVLHVQQLVTADGGAVVETDEEAQGILRRALGQLRAGGLGGRGEAVVGHGVAAAIVDEAERLGADLVILASRRPRDITGLLLGSVAHQVIHRLRRPVLLAGRARAGELSAAQ
jgi:nucleotide-binding universal stress UspA family protein